MGAEADPAYYYGGYGYPYAFGNYPAYYVPHVAQKVVKAVEAGEVTASEEETVEAEEVKDETAVKAVTVPFFAHHGLYPFGAYRTYAPYTYAPYTTYGHNYVSYTNGHPVTYAFAPKAPVEDKKMTKREAEPEVMLTMDIMDMEGDMVTVDITVLTPTDIVDIPIAVSTMDVKRQQTNIRNHS